MPKYVLNSPATLIVISLMLFQASHVNAQTEKKVMANAPTFNFSYKIVGDRTVAPLQAFDNGSKTYLQFRDLSTLPAIFTDTPAGKILLKAGSEYDVEPPFVVLRKIEPELLLVMNKRQAFVTYKGQANEEHTQKPVMYGAKQPMVITGSVKPPVAASEFTGSPGVGMLSQKSIIASPTTPVVQPNAVSLAASLAPEETVVGPQPAKNVDTGIPSENPQPLAPAREWKIALSDKSVRGLLERWSKEDNYQLLWEISVDLQIGASATISGTFEDALASVLTSLSNSEYPVEAMIYDNRVVRVVKQTPRNK